MVPAVCMCLLGCLLFPSSEAAIINRYEVLAKQQTDVQAAQRAVPYNGLNTGMPTQNMGPYAGTTTQNMNPYNNMNPAGFGPNISPVGGMPGMGFVPQNMPAVNGMPDGSGMVNPAMTNPYFGINPNGPTFNGANPGHPQYNGVTMEGPYYQGYAAQVNYPTTDTMSAVDPNRVMPGYNYNRMQLDRGGASRSIYEGLGSEFLSRGAGFIQPYANSGDGYSLIANSVLRSVFSSLGFMPRPTGGYLVGNRPSQSSTDLTESANPANPMNPANSFNTNNPYNTANTISSYNPVNPYNPANNNNAPISHNNGYNLGYTPTNGGRAPYGLATGMNGVNRSPQDTTGMTNPQSPATTNEAGNPYGGQAASSDSTYTQTPGGTYTDTAGNVYTQPGPNTYTHLAINGYTNDGYPKPAGTAYTNPAGGAFGSTNPQTPYGTNHAYNPNQAYGVNPPYGNDYNPSAYGLQPPATSGTEADQAPSNAGSDSESSASSPAETSSPVVMDRRILHGLQSAAALLEGVNE